MRYTDKIDFVVNCQFIVQQEIKDFFLIYTNLIILKVAYYFCHHINEICLGDTILEEGYYATIYITNTRLWNCK